MIQPARIKKNYEASCYAQGGASLSSAPHDFPGAVSEELPHPQKAQTEQSSNHHQRLSWDGVSSFVVELGGEGMGWWCLTPTAGGPIDVRCFQDRWITYFSLPGKANHQRRPGTPGLPSAAAQMRLYAEHMGLTASLASVPPCFRQSCV